MPAQALILIRFWRRNSSRPLGFILQSYSALFTKVNSLTLFAVRLHLNPLLRSGRAGGDGRGQRHAAGDAAAPELLPDCLS